MASTFYVGDEEQLNNALTAIDLGGADSAPDTAYSIVFTQSVELTNELDAVNLASGSSLSIDGSNYVLNGDGDQQGLFAYSGALSVSNLTIAATQALGGSGAGGGAGLGGGLFVASGASANLTNVNFLDDKASGGDGSAGGGDGSGGGGLGGNGDFGGGGIGSTAVGGGIDAAGGLGIVLGEPDNGGGGGSNSSYFADYSSGGGVGGSFGDNQAGQGGFGGGGGAAQTDDPLEQSPGYPGGDGGFGGGGGSGSEGDDAPLDAHYFYVADVGGTGGNGGFGGGAGVAGYTESAGFYLSYGVPPSSPGVPGFGGGAAIPGSDGGGVGGGGLGAGGAIFVQQGGSLTYSGGSVFDGAVQGGNAGQANAGSAFGSGIFLQGNQSVTFEPRAGSVMTIADVIADQTGSGGTGSNAGAGSVYVGNGSTAGTVVLSGQNTYTGGTAVESGTLELAKPGSAGTGSISIAKGAVLQIDTAAMPTNTIEGLASGGALDLRAIPYGLGLVLAIRTGLSTDATLTVLSAASNGTITQASLKLDDPTAPLLSVLTTENDGFGGTLVIEDAPRQAPCFATGTLIDCEIGSATVDNLQVGDRVLLSDGGSAAIIWIGHRRQRNGHVVRVSAHALAHNVPRRDLIVSDDHGLLIDGVLVPAGLLVNDTTILLEQRDDVTLWHVELSHHEILLAEGAPAESYLDTGNRAQFGNCPMSYDPVNGASTNDPCAEMVLGGHKLNHIRERLPTMA